VWILKHICDASIAIIYVNTFNSNINLNIFNLSLLIEVKHEHSNIFSFSFSFDRSQTWSWYKSDEFDISKDDVNIIGDDVNIISDDVNIISDDVNIISNVDIKQKIEVILIILIKLIWNNEMNVYNNINVIINVFLVATLTLTL